MLKAKLISLLILNVREAQAINLQVLFKRNERLNQKIRTHAP